MDDKAATAELEHLKARNKKLAEDRAYFQLILRLIEKLDPLPGLEDMLRNMLFNIVECLGGTNIKLYYWVGEELHYQDFLGENKCLTAIDDPDVAQVAKTHEFLDRRGGAEEAMLMHGMLRGSWTWTFPLPIGQDLVGVIKLENLHIHGESLGKYLPIFFSHAALILGNEIRNTLHRRSEEDLHIATERLQLATEAGLIGIWDWDIVRDQLVWDESMYRLYGRREGDFGGAYQAWIAAVHPDDKDYTEGEIQAALRGEREYAPEFRVVWPDGSVHYIKAASKTTYDAAGRPLRMVGINYDLTERRRAEEESRANLRSLEAMDRVNRAIQGAKGLEQMMSDVLDVVLAVFGCDRAFLQYPCDPRSVTWRVPMERTRPEWPGVLALDHEVPMDADVARTLRMLLAADGPVMFGPGTPYPLPADISERYGFKCFMSMAIRPKIGNAWQFGIHQCTHARQWTADEERLLKEIGRRVADGLSALLARRDLEESERRYRVVFENSPVSIWEEDFSGVKALFDRLRAEGIADIEAHFDEHPETVERCAELVGVVDVNEATLLLHGATGKGELLAGLTRTFTPESFRSFRQELACLWRGETTMVTDAVVKTLAGELRYVTVNFSVCPGYEQSLAKVLISLTDITERKRAEAAQHRLNRELRAISDCNQALMRAEDEPSLLQDVCRIICEEAGYRMAWVGYAERDDAKSVRPVGWAGFEDGYLTTAEITWADSERGRGPTGTAIRTGTTQFIDDFATDPRAAPWREMALQRGYRSSIALPLAGGEGGPLGTLTIYSGEAGAFNAEERRLLEELAGDLTFGISVLRGRVERKKAELRLRESEQLFRALAENSPDFIVRYDLDFRRIYVNPAMLRAFGKPLEEVLGKVPVSGSVAHDPQSYTTYLRQVVETGRECSAEIAHRNVDGETRWNLVRYVPEFGPDGKVETILTIGRDIHELKKSEQRFRMLADNFPDYIVRFDRAGACLYVNPAVEAVFGLPAAAILGKPLRELLPGSEALPGLIRRAFDQGMRNEVEERWITEIGERIVELRNVPEKDAVGNVVSVLCIAHDITERKRAEAELERHRLHLEELVATRTQELALARDVAESANRMKSVFLANMSHELRTPLNAILGFAQIMGRDERIPEDERNNLQAINRSGRHLLTLINDVLEISRIEAGRLVVQPSSFDLPEMLAALRESQELRARDKGLELRMTLAPDLPRYVVADAGKLRQVLLNLLSNAVKYTERGEVEFSAAMDAGGQRPLLRFGVRDTGVGIGTEDMEKIFQPFFQAEYGVALGEGTGLGLTISRDYAQLLGGSVSVESEPGRGSVFRFSVPVDLAEATSLAKSVHGPVVGLAAGQGARVLVVEDNADSRRLLEELLKQTEFQVRTANDGSQAVEVFRAWQPDFIWMDMRMPVLDGYEAARRIRALPGGNKVKIAALTASAFREDRGEIIAAGCDEVLSKPLEEEQIFATMERLLGLRYRYAEPAATHAPAAEADLSGLPAELRRALGQAAHLLDVEAAEQEIGRIREIDGPLADELQALVHAYRYDRIVALCDAADS